MIRFFLIHLLVFICAFPALGAVILIDPGHGGEEWGAVGMLDGGRKVMEKDLSLRLANKIANKLRPMATVFLSRSMDRTVSLQERADMADKLKADLFISVHFNSSTDASAHGFETYYLDNSKDAAVKKVERQENLTGSGEEHVINQILVDLVIQQTVRESRALAKELHKRLHGHMKTVGLSDRGMRPGLFYVLALSKRPGVLLEAGFISNPSELKMLQQEEFLERYATAASIGISDFLRQKKRARLGPSKKKK